jgi:hypothetical protein
LAKLGGAAQVLCGVFSPMKNLLGKLLFAGTIALAAGAVPHVRAAQPAALPGDALYVIIGTDDPLAFDRYRYGRDSGKVNQDLIVPTLRNQASAMAAAAHWAAPVVVLNENASPPAGEPVLRLTWGDGNAKVFAEYLPTAAAKAHFLGIVSRDSLAYHPTPDAALNRVLSATSEEAKHDEAIRANTEMELYLALQLVEEHLGHK